MFEVRTGRYESLTAEEQENASNCGGGKEDATYIRVMHNGATIALESDAMEPEDATFRRDLSWIAPLLVQCYELGKADGK